ncbi:WD40 repeat-like protein [Ceraceosorus guamensis]|uniref:WD40 repeat-like protein n=1 Tax=Ceraceosorus guamensis TaxID=1522189 RepID=A0A316VPS3_9BASI|nr:WD40 repeat-like protein [Ceraceosorus guamensis]PWN39078.1 WD40 repeat-like protein [Ceraceosorus guamensis]
MDHIEAKASWPPSSLSGRFPTTCTNVIRAHTGPINAALFNSRSAYILSASSDRQVRLFSTRSPPASSISPESSLGVIAKKGKVDEGIKTYDSANNAVLALALAPSDKIFAQAGMDRSVNVVDVQSGGVVRRFNAHTGAVHALAFAGASSSSSSTNNNNPGAPGLTGGDSLLLAAGFDARCRLYDLRASGAWKPIMELKESKDTIFCLDVSGGIFRTAGMEGVVRTYDARMGQMTEDVAAAPIVSLSSTSTSLLISTSSQRRAAHHLLSTSDGTLQKTLIGHQQSNPKSPFRSIFVRPVKNTAAAAAADPIGVLSGSEQAGPLLWKLNSNSSATAAATRTADAREGSAAEYPTGSACLGVDQARDGSLCSYHQDGTIRIWRMDGNS